MIAPSSLWQWLVISSAIGPLLMFAVNLFFYREPPHAASGARMPQVSVLIPARNEEASIGSAVSSVLASTGVTVELLVLDDDSTDGTAAAVLQLAEMDGRLVLHAAPPLALGWNGKQHACHVLSSMARHDWLCFLDADVRIAPELLARLVAYAEHARLDLVSGFPLEQTGTFLERLLIPLVHFMLLGYLPIPGSVLFPRVPGFSAGCGQVMLARRAGYQACGGHAAIRQTMHDGILLPRLARKAGLRTGLCDLTALATCRMYCNAAQVWSGLSKNATEGLAAPARIVPFTVVLILGQIAPVFWLATAALRHQPLLLPALATACGYLARAVAMLRFRQSLLGAVLHPAGVAVLLALQWWALASKLRGRQAVWKQRPYRVG